MGPTAKCYPPGTIPKLPGRFPQGILRPMKTLCALLILTLSTFAKDKDITVAQCPLPVKATIAEYSKKFPFQKVEIEKNSKPTLYGAKFFSPDGRRFELIMAADGKVQRTEVKKEQKDKKPKKDKSDT